MKPKPKKKAAKVWRAHVYSNGTSIFITHSDDVPDWLPARQWSNVEIRLSKPRKRGRR